MPIVSIVERAWPMIAFACVVGMCFAALRQRLGNEVVQILDCARRMVRGEIGLRGVELRAQARRDAVRQARTRHVAAAAAGNDTHTRLPTHLIVRATTAAPRSR